MILVQDHSVSEGPMLLQFTVKVVVQRRQESRVTLTLEQLTLFYLGGGEVEVEIVREDFTM